VILLDATVLSNFAHRCLTLAEADTCLREMIAHGYRSPVTSLADVRTSRP